MTSKLRSNSYVLSVRMTPEEHTALKEAAGSLTVSAYARTKLLGNAAAKPRASHAPKPEKALLAQILGTLGRSGLSASLANLAKAAQSGAMPVTEDAETALLRACADIAKIKSLLMGALGIKED
ncbi:hypothetical protein QMT40_000402 [Parvibaculaceae bacterium PLY_AMNH_Bact1]|nr:hypothetical protein QMT40_000402 [Parvibaculaceae bacterium PLY_AMNH_Bact1]